MEKKLLEPNNINGFYGKAQVLFDLSYRATNGSIGALIGANSTGKKCKCFVYVHKDRRLFSELNVQENLELRAFAKCKRAYMKESLEYVFEFFPYSDNTHLPNGVLTFFDK